jgi:hypothetical protein
MAPNLWLGGYDYHPAGTTRASFTTEMIVREKFDVVISFYRPYGVDLSRVEHHSMRIPDGALTAEELAGVQSLAELAYLRSTTGQKVLIHCQAGINRSSLCMVYALQRRGWTAELAIDHIRATRSPFCLVNEDFVGYLTMPERVWDLSAGIDGAPLLGVVMDEVDFMSALYPEAAASVRLDGETQVIDTCPTDCSECKTPEAKEAP